MAKVDIDQKVTLTRVICPTCGRVLLEGEINDLLILRCQNCGDVFEAYANAPIPLPLKKWQEEIHVTR